MAAGGRVPVIFVVGGLVGKGVLCIQGGNVDEDDAVAYVGAGVTCGGNVDGRKVVEKVIRGEVDGTLRATDCWSVIPKVLGGEVDWINCSNEMLGGNVGGTPAWHPLTQHTSLQCSSVFPQNCEELRIIMRMQ